MALWPYCQLSGINRWASFPEGEGMALAANDDERPHAADLHSKRGPPRCLAEDRRLIRFAEKKCAKERLLTWGRLTHGCFLI